MLFPTQQMYFYLFRENSLLWNLQKTCISTVYLYRERKASPSPEVEISVVDQSESNPPTDQNSVCSDRPASARPPAPTPNTARSGKVMSPLPEEEGARWVICLIYSWKMIFLCWIIILFRLSVKSIELKANLFFFYESINNKANNNYM